MTESYVYHDSSIRLPCRVRICAMVTLLVYTFDMAHSYVWHYSFTCVTRLIYTCDMTDSYAWHNSRTYARESLFTCWYDVYVYIHSTHCNTLRHNSTHYNTHMHTPSYADKVYLCMHESINLNKYLLSLMHIVQYVHLICLNGISIRIYICIIQIDIYKHMYIHIYGYICTCACVCIYEQMPS